MRISTSILSLKLRQWSFQSIPLENRRINGILAPAAAALLSAIVYWITMPSDLTWINFGRDGAELITASVTLGVPHPPGYPTYVLLGKLFSLLPVGPTIAYRFNLFSVLSMSVAVGFVAASANRLLMSLSIKKTARKVTAFLLALSFAFIPLVWSQAIIAEVYALNLCFIAITLWLLVKPTDKQRPLLMGIFLGLSITTHLTSLLLIPLVLSQLTFRIWPRLILGLVIGLLPFLALPLLGSTNSPVIWGSPSTLGGWWWLVSAKLYQPYIGFPELIRNLTYSVKTASLIAVITIMTLGLIGFIKNRDAFRKLFAIPLDSAIALTAGGYFIYAALYNSNDAILNILPAFVLLTLLLSKLAIRVGPWLLILPMVLVAVNLMVIQPETQQAPRLRGEETLRGAPEGAILISSGERTTFTLWYLQFVEGQRKDLLLVDKDLFQFDWYRRRLASNYPALLSLDRYDLEEFTSENSMIRDICLTNLESSHQLICY